MTPAEPNRSRGSTTEKEPILESRKFHEVWVEQCEAAKEIKRRYGLRAAFDYLVAEKLLNFADAATTHPEFARELPQFVAHVRGLFTVEEMRTHLNRIQCEQRDGDAYIGERDEFDEEGEQEEDAMSLESPTAAKERARQFAIIAELLTAADLGTS
jgi:hypothetical protein